MAMEDLSSIRQIVRPGSTAELSEIVRSAAGDNFGLFPIGGGTMMHVGRPPSRSGIGVDLTAMNEVVEYPARDMTITVQAGMTVDRLRQILSAERQRLPIDIPFARRATIGGSIAAHLSGPRRFGFGTLRDYVIGLRFIDDHGHEVQGGGRVVKNVAGYDLCKLHTGAFGSLGIITQVTLKLRPLPETHACASFSCPRGALAEVLNRLHATATRPVYVEVQGEADQCRLTVGFEENASAVAWQIDQIQHEFPGTAMQVIHGDAADDRVQMMTESIHASAVWSWKASLRSSAVAGFVQDLSERGFVWQSHALSGIVWGRAAGDMPLEQAIDELTRLRRAAEDSQGSVIVWRCPSAWKAKLDLYGPDRPDGRLMRAIKRQVDPHDRFNPGRFIGS